MNDSVGSATRKPPEEVLETAQQVTETYQEMMEQMARVIIGQQDVMELMLLGLFCQGHCILEGVPGLAKTLMISSLSQLLSLQFGRIQFTPDLMPSDITGTEILEEDQSTGKRFMRFVRGPIFANMVLADEINRTPPKTQAALLQAMQEYQVTIAGEHHDLDLPFFVLGTQNPIESEGTYPLPEAALDHFMFKIKVDYPLREKAYPFLPGEYPQDGWWKSFDVKGAGKVPVLLDCAWSSGLPLYEDPPPDYDGQTSSYAEMKCMRFFCVNRHDGAVNGLFMDFSARKIGLKELWDLSWHWDWNRDGDLPPEWPGWMRRF